MSRRSVRAAALGGLLLVAGAAFAQGPAPALAKGQNVEQEQADVQQRLAAERTNLELLRSKRLSVLELLELMEKLSKLSAARVQAVDGQMRQLRQRIAVAERVQAVADAALSAQLTRLAPRLTVMYRMLRKNPLEALLSAQDFAALMWRARAMTRLLDSDLRLLGDVQRAARFQRQSLRELAALKVSLDAEKARLAAASKLADRQHRELTDMVDLIQGEAAQSMRVIHELETADHELAALLNAMDEAHETKGFGARKGHLPMPAQGVVEVGFGRVVNPLFNTVTVQKGLDIRAPEGSPVSAVAPGKVVFSGWLRGYGNLLIIDHGDGYHSLVAHLAELGRQVGETVQAGDALGTVGDTGSLKGAYLYFELRRRGQAVDPTPWLSKRR